MSGMLVLFPLIMFLYGANAMCYLQSIPKNVMNTSASSASSSLLLKNGWCADPSDTNPYLQVDLGAKYFICSIVLKGTSTPRKQWIRSYFVNTSFDGTTWTTHQENGKNREFTGCRLDDIKSRRFPVNMNTNYIRIIPVTWVPPYPCITISEIYGVKQKAVNYARNKAVTSSPLSSGTESDITDGDGSTCVLTNIVNNPSISVDLGSATQLINDIQVKAGDGSGLTQGFEVFVDSSKCGSFKVQPHQTITVECFPLLNGQYVNITVPRTANISLCDIQVTLRENFATKTTSSEMSSTETGSQAEYAYNGNRQQCATTDPNDHATAWLYLKQSVPLVSLYEVQIRVQSPGTYSFHYYKPFHSFSYILGEPHPISNYGIFMLYSSKTYLTRFYIQRVTGRPLKICELELYDSNRPCVLSSLGVKSVTFEYIHLSASSGDAARARLLGTTAWVPYDNDTTPYVQVDLLYKAYVCAIATQGSPKNDSWTTSYKVAVSLDNVNYKEVDGGKHFAGNHDRNSIVKNIFSTSYFVNFVRVYPITKYGNFSLRLELYGTPQECGKTAVTPNSLLYSSNEKCQSIANPDYGTYSLNFAVFEGIAIQGSPTSDRWVTSFSIQYFMDLGGGGEDRWVDYKESGDTNITVFVGNWDRDSLRVITFKKFFYAKKIRIIPKSFHGDKWCMRYSARYCLPGIWTIFLVTLNAESNGLFPGYINQSCTSIWVTRVQHEWKFNGNWVVKDTSENKIVSETIFGHTGDAVKTTMDKYYTTCDDLLVDFNCIIPTLPQRDIICKSKQFQYCIAYAIANFERYKYAKSKTSITLKLPDTPTNGTVTNMLPYSSFDFSFDTNEDIIADSEYLVNITNANSTTKTYRLTPPNKKITYTGTQPSSYYNVTVAAKNCFGQGMPYEKRIFAVAIDWESTEISLEEQSGCFNLPGIKRRWHAGNVIPPIVVRVQAIDVTATSGKDYTFQQQNITFQNNEDEKRNVSVCLTDDNIVKGDKTFKVVITSDLLLVDIQKSTLMVTITDNDQVEFSLENVNATLQEEDGYTTVCVSKNGSNDIPVNVSLISGAQSVNWTAEIRKDFSGELYDKQLMFEPNTNRICRNLTIINDGEAENTEYFSIELKCPQSASNCVLGSRRVLKITIKDQFDVSEKERLEREREERKAAITLTFLAVACGIASLLVIVFIVILIIVCRLPPLQPTAQ